MKSLTNRIGSENPLGNVYMLELLPCLRWQINMDAFSLIVPGANQCVDSRSTNVLSMLRSKHIHLWQKWQKKTSCRFTQ